MARECRSRSALVRDPLAPAHAGQWRTPNPLESLMSGFQMTRHGCHASCLRATICGRRWIGREQPQRPKRVRPLRKHSGMVFSRVYRWGKRSRAMRRGSARPIPPDGLAGLVAYIRGAAVTVATCPTSTRHGRRNRARRPRARPGPTRSDGRAGRALSPAGRAFRRWRHRTPQEASRLVAFRERPDR